MRTILDLWISLIGNALIDRFFYFCVWVNFFQGKPHEGTQGMIPYIHGGHP